MRHRVRTVFRDSRDGSRSRIKRTRIYTPRGIGGGITLAIFKSRNDSSALVTATSRRLINVRPAVPFLKLMDYVNSEKAGTQNGTHGISVVGNNRIISLTGIISSAKSTLLSDAYRHEEN